MRILATALILLFVLLPTGSALADPSSIDAKDEWESNWEMSGYRAIVPEVEPNNPCPTSQLVALGDIVDPATINPAGDFDFYKIYLLTTDRLTVLLDRATGCTTTYDTYMDILRDDCTTVILSDDDDGPGLYSYIRGSEWTPPYDGYYYVKVRGYSSSTTGCYKAFFFGGLNALGACCNLTTGACTLVEPGSCSTPSVFQGPGTVCSPNPCPQPQLGACCTPTGSCTITLPANCTSPNTWYGQYTTCSPNPCPQPMPNNTCATALPLERCSGGTIQGTMAGATNDYNPAVPGPSCTGFSAAGPDVVWVLNLLAGDSLHVVYTTPSYDGSIYLVTDCSNVSGSCVIGEDDPEPETFGYKALNSGTYYLIVDAFSSSTSGSFTLAWSVICPPPVGACCFPDGTCQVLTEADCAAAQGIWYGATDPDCEPNPCPQPPAFACCFPDGSCRTLTEAACLQAGGAPRPGVACDPNPCPQGGGACCFPDGTCLVLTNDACDAQGGFFLGGPCDPNPCPLPLGACCFPDGSCQVLTEEECLAAGGIWQGRSVTPPDPCDPNPCPQPLGACCFPDGSCQVTLQADCPTGVWYMLRECQPNPCPQPLGACCYPNGDCVVTLQADCPTGDWRVFVPCDPNPCPQPPPVGACCFLDGTCQVLTEAECAAAQGTWYGATNPDCDPNPCPPPVPVERTSWGRIKSNYR